MNTADALNKAEHLVKESELQAKEKGLQRELKKFEFENFQKRFMIFQSHMLKSQVRFNKVLALTAIVLSASGLLPIFSDVSYKGYTIIRYFLFLVIGLAFLFALIEMGKELNLLRES